MKNRKVAFLTEVPASYRNPLFEKLSQRQDLSIEVIYCVPEQCDTRWWKQEAKNYPYKVLPGFAYPLVGRGVFVLKINPGIWNQLSKGDYDAVIIGGYIQPTMQLAILWCLLYKVPYILWSESHHLTPRPILIYLLKWPLVNFSVRNAAAFLSTGSESRDYLISYGAKRTKVFLFPNNPDVRTLIEDSLSYRKDIQKLRQELNIFGSPLIIYSGRLIGHKDIQTLLIAFQLVQRQIPQVGLVIVGEGPLRRSLENLSGKLKLSNVYFAGFVQPKDLVKYYSCADIFVLPSSYEPWGVVVLEAMSCGLPVVVSDKVGCARDLVYPNRNGFIFSAKNIPGLSSAITKLCQDPQLRREMASYSREIALKWDYDFSISQLMQALKIAVV